MPVGESPNDLGASHTIMHEQYSSPHFRYVDAIDPIGKPYEQLKEYLERYLDPSSFKTIWKFCCKSKAFVDRAFTISNVKKSSFKSAGIFPRSDREILFKKTDSANCLMERLRLCLHLFKDFLQR